MKNREIEDKLKQSINHAVPDVLDEILSRCEQQKGKENMMFSIKKQNKKWIGIAAAAALLAVVGGTGFFYGRYTVNYRVDSIVALDVNPSIELKVNEKERIIDARALNADAVQILDGMDLKNTQLEVAINALVGSMLKNGYIDELANSILITVENKDEAKGTILEEKLTKEVNEFLEASAVDASIISQTLTQNKELDKLAQQNNISTGKAALIQKMVEQNSAFRFEELAGLSINELNLLASSQNIEDISGETKGTASDKAYLEEGKVKQIVLQHTNLKENQIQNWKCNLDFEDGKIVYDVEFYVDKVEYDYEVDAQDGTIIKHTTEQKETSTAVTEETTQQPTTTIPPTTQQPTTAIPPTTQPPTTVIQTTTQQPTTVLPETTTTQAVSLIGEAKAKEIALAHAKVSESEIILNKCKLDFEDGKQVYDVEFYSGNTEYDYEIDAVSGSIIEYDMDIEDFIIPSTTKIPETTQTVSLIGEAKAKEIALAHAKVSESEIILNKCKLDFEDGKQVYDVEFYSGNTEYDYEIDAVSGSIIEYDMDIEDFVIPNTTQNSQESSNIISEAKAKEIALQYAGLSENSISSFKMELDREDERMVYEIEFRQGEMEYEGEIDALNGNILKWETDIDD